MLLSAIHIQIIDLNEHLFDFVLRLLLASICGFLIGYERKSRSKEAGIRTHTIVCMASTLIMLVSKYGFENGTGDLGRIAAQIVSGIGFLGAGIIFYRRDVLHGLTTAAGIWATAGIGMAFGTGMLMIGVISTIILLLLQVILHLPLRIMKGRIITTLRIVVRMEETGENDVLDQIQYLFEAKKFLKFKTMNGEECITAEIELVTERAFTAKELYDITKTYSFIKTLEKTDEV